MTVRAIDIASRVHNFISRYGNVALESYELQYNYEMGIMGTEIEDR